MHHLLLTLEEIENNYLVEFQGGVSLEDLKIGIVKIDQVLSS